MDSDSDSDSGLVWRSSEEIQTARDLVSSISTICSSCQSDSDITENSSDRANKIVSLINDFLTMIPTKNIYDCKDHVNMFLYSDAPAALVSLVLNAPVQCYKQAGEEAVKLFLYPNIRSIPKPVRKHCVQIVSAFCALLYTSQNVGDQHLLYYACRKSLVSLLKLIGFRKRSKYVYEAEPSDTIGEFCPFVEELARSLSHTLHIVSQSFLTQSLALSIESDVRLLAFFSRYMRRAIEDHVRLKGQSLPLNLDDNFENQPCYLLNLDFLSIVVTRNLETKTIFNYEPRWFFYLSVMRELKNLSKLFLNYEEELFSQIRMYRSTVDVLIRFSKRSEDLQWLVESKNLINSSSRRCLVMKMLPEVKFDFEDRQKILVDRSQILTESFEHLSHGTPKSLRSGLSVEFTNEVATGQGVLREWLLLVCQELFNPQGSLFLACPNDCRRFFPNPATLEHGHLNYFAFAGRVIALALMHKVQVGISFDRVFFLQLAGGLVSLEDIQEADPVMYKSCKTLLEMDANFVDSDAMALTFAREVEVFGSKKVVELCPGGSTIVVNSSNREEYIELLIQHCFVKPISEKLCYFTRGFGDILCERRFQKTFFQSLELKDLDLMLLGNDKAICVQDWKAHTDYSGYENSDDQICWFWEVIEGMSAEQRMEFLFFWTSVKFLPRKGFSSLSSRLRISKVAKSDHHLPSSRTCFHHLTLPQYSSLPVMKQRLLFVCQEHVDCSFGML
ncbi:hypothetical protein MKW94_019816 [Papaver nudicaule]|uniref:HECT-type E3 ubiquitin transferase n=1 Tax=Papaver nudicaule TaxID=74823 RepID=A0AA41RRV8_PAPNU|nr:hypothetical protein [Papaver nudicaule]